MPKNNSLGSQAQSLFDRSVQMLSPLVTDPRSDPSYGYFNMKDLSDEQQAILQEQEYGLRSAREAMNFEEKQAELNRDFQQASAREAMAFEADQARINRDWQEQMSSSAYQRAVGDLKAAGLNPVLAAYNGGAATTSGATASGYSASGSTASGYAVTNSSSRPTGEKANRELASMLLTTAAQIGAAMIFRNGNITSKLISKGFIKL